MQGFDIPDQRCRKVHVTRGHRMFCYDVHRISQPSDPLRAAAGLSNLPKECSNRGQVTFLGPPYVGRQESPTGASMPRKTSVSVVCSNVPNLVCVLSEYRNRRGKHPERQLGGRRQTRLQYLSRAAGGQPSRVEEELERRVLIAAGPHELAGGAKHCQALACKLCQAVVPLSVCGGSVRARAREAGAGARAAEKEVHAPLRSAALGRTPADLPAS
mmetsp:Transcript_6188/g.18547  ORF Transcript_6188/g.18547 Transcript_6188/m.18547 type:complete len:215 (-) Transcript_6188:53-697(-)